MWPVPLYKLLLGRTSQFSIAQPLEEAQLHKQIYYYLVSPQAWDMNRFFWCTPGQERLHFFYSRTLNCLAGRFYLNVTGLTLGQVRNICSVFWSVSQDLCP